MRNLAFTLVELIVAITILAILGTIAFISFNGYSEEARDTKRITDVRNLLNKINIENTSGIPLSDLITEEKSATGQLLGVANTPFKTMGEVDFGNLKENEANFHDPSTNLDYPVAYAIGGAGTGIYNFIQIATINEKENITKIIGNYYTTTTGDVPSLFTKDGINYYTNNGTPIYDLVPPNPYEPSVPGVAEISYLETTYTENGQTWKDIIIKKGDGTGYTIMDRNMGATLVGTGTSTEYRGNHYQWGNNFGFSSENTGVYANRLELSGKMTVTSENENSNYTVDLYVALEPDTTSGNWAQSNDETMPEIKSAQQILDNLWGGLKTGTRQEIQKAQRGPCPNGYHIPTNLEWQALIDIGNIAGWWPVTDGNSLMNKLLMPKAGRRSSTTSSMELFVNRGYYWSSIAVPGNNSHAYFLYFISNAIDPQNTLRRADAYSIRCFKN